MTRKPRPSNTPSGWARCTFAPRQCRADKIRKPFQDIDAHSALPANTITRGTIKCVRRVFVDGDRCAPARCKVQQLADALRVRTLRHCPKLRCERTCAGFSSAGDRCGGPEAHAVFSQSGTGRLVEPLHFLGNFRRSSTPSASTSWNATPRAIPVTSSAAVKENSGASNFSIWVFSQRSSLRLDQFACRASKVFVSDDPHPRAQSIVAGDQSSRRDRRSNAAHRRSPERSDRLKPAKFW